MAISFKNVGTIKNPGRDYASRNRSEVPIGIKTPVELDLSTNTFLAMHTSVRAQIGDNLKNLLATNWGERLGLYDFGANLTGLLSEFTNLEDFENEAALRINTAIQRWMPYVEPIDLESELDREYRDITSLAHLKIILTYAIPMLQVSRDKVEVNLVAM